MQPAEWVPEDIDVEQPSAARIYDYWLGGSHNFAVDREVARQVAASVPHVALIMQDNRAFLRRVVRYLVDAGISQFLDIGSGIPTLGNVHEVAQKALPEAKVVYVDIDPVAVAHSRQILVGNSRTVVIQEDLRRPERIINHPHVRSLLEFGQPVAVLLLAVLHFIPDEDAPGETIAWLRDSVVPGSYLALSHGTVDPMPSEETDRSIELFKRTTTPGYPRPYADVLAYFDGFDLVEPGLVWTSAWRPEHPDDVAEDPQRSAAYAGLGVKR